MMPGSIESRATALLDLLVDERSAVRRRAALAASLVCIAAAGAAVLLFMLGEHTYQGLEDRVRHVLRATLAGGDLA